MATENGERPREKEIKIPVFSVLKKGSILKHIFFNSPETGFGDYGDVPNQEEEPILIGRHPDCHIVLDHPSISRFHLEVRVEPAKQKLSVIDRSSVHGTWVSGTKIQPNVPVDLVDGDMLRLGASTRVYRFQWVPLSRASEMEKPMEPLLEEKEETCEEEIPMPLNANSDDMLASKIHSVSPTNSSSLDEFSCLPLQMESQSPVAKEFDEEEILSFLFYAPVVESASFSPAKNGENGELDDFSAVGIPSEREKLSPLESEKRAMSSRLLSRRSKSISLLRIPNGRAKEKAGSMSFAKDMEEEIQREDIKEQGEEEGSLSKVLFADIDEKEIRVAFDSAKENSLPKISVDQKSKKSHRLQNSPSNVVHLNAQEEVFNLDKDNWTPEVSKERGRKKFVSMSSVENKEQDAYSSDGEHMTVGTSFDQKKEHTSFERSPSVAISALNLKEDMFHSDREMRTPESCRMQRRKEQIFENHMENEKEDASASDKDNVRPQLSFDQVLKENQRDLLGSSSIDISSSSVEENQFLYDRMNWTPEISVDLKLKQPISENNASNKREKETFSLDKENSTTEFYSDQKFKSNQDDQQPCLASSNAEGVFHSDKENQTPEVPRTRKIKKPMFENFGKIEAGEDLFLSDKENLTPEVSRAQIYIKPISESLAKVEREMRTPESCRMQRRKEQIFENHMENEKEDASASDKDNVRPQLSFDQVLKENQRDLLGSSSIDISSSNVEENQFLYDRMNWTPEISVDLKLKQPIAENNASNKREKETFSLDKENSTTEFYSDQKFKSNQDDQQPCLASSNAEGVFHSDKENQTPEVPRTRKIKKPIFENFGKIEAGEDLFLSDKENLTPEVSRAQIYIKPISESLAKVEREIMRKRVERVPFQLLLDNNCVMNSQRMVEKCNNTSVNSISANHHPANNTERVEYKRNGTLNQPMGQILGNVEEKKKWNIVVDTSCFLNEESKRSLQLLEGLKGTQLIIPMMVIRELDRMKHHESWFRKEIKASSALKWIEECMVKSSWWIHVQSSSEMTPVASTPPASPYSIFAEGNTEFGVVPSGLMGFSTCGSLMEIVSPTVEDHILDTALLFKRITTDGQLVLLSNNITLKIKAMAEGLLCERPKEFRDSLVNPYSKRFLWKKSSPRGSTWSSSDQMAYTDNYYHQLPNIRRAADSKTGLKLILLHNSHYAQTNLVK